jgi:hypothetical protein
VKKTWKKQDPKIHTREDKLKTKEPKSIKEYIQGKHLRRKL